MHFRNVHITFCIRFECDNDYLSFDLFERAERSKKRMNKRKSNRLDSKQRNDTKKSTVFAERFATVLSRSHREFRKDRNGLRNEIGKKRITTTDIYEQCSSRSFCKSILIFFLVCDFFFVVFCCCFLSEFSLILWLKFIYEAANSACYWWINHILWACVPISDWNLPTKKCYIVTIFV